MEGAPKFDPKRAKEWGGAAPKFDPSRARPVGEPAKPAEKGFLESAKETAQDAFTSFDPAFGLRDEIWGAIGAAFDPDKVGGDVGTRYASYRDAERGVKQKAMERSPIASTVGKLAGDAASMAVPGVGIAKLGATGASAGLGAASAVQGFGDSNKGLPGALSDAALAGSMGLALPVAFGAAGAGLSGLQRSGALDKGRVLVGKGLDKAEGAFNRGVDLVEDFGEGAAKVAQSVKSGAKSGGLTGSVAGIVEGVGEIFKTARFNSGVMKAVEGSSGRSLKGASDAEIRAVMFEELAKPGDSTFKRWIADEVGRRTGKNSDELLEVLRQGSGRRNEVRSWDADAQLSDARNVARKFQGMSDEVETGRSMARSRLERSAAEEYAQARKAGAPDPLDDIQAYVDELLPVKRAKNEGPGKVDANRPDEFVPDWAMDDPLESGKGASEAIRQTAQREELSLIPAKNQAEISKAMAILEEGAGVKGMERFGLRRGSWQEVDPSEQYARMQQARELIDEQRQYFAANGLGKAEQLMMGLRERFDQALKAQASKVKSDRLWSESERALSNVQGPISYRDPSGRTSIDPVKVRRSFQKTDTGQRMDDYVQDFERTMGEFDLGNYQTREETLDAWRAGARKADDRARVLGFEKDGSPSGLAIERLQASNAKNIVQEFLASPGNTLRKIDEAVKSKGRTWTPEELQAVMKWRAVFEQLSRNPTQKPVSSSSGLGTALGAFAATTVGKQVMQSMMGGE